MKTIYESYSSFCTLLESPSSLSQSFEELCFLLHVSPVDLGRLIEDELGYTGPGLLHALRVSSGA